MRKLPELIAITGPTASGKTALAIELAGRISGEIVSCDSMMVYRGMNIGTAKPDAAEMRGIAHHMLDVADPGENYSASHFRDDARKVIDEIRTRGNFPILCGGTGLYIDAVTRDMSFANIGSDAGVRGRLHEELDREGAQAMHARLLAVDPETARRLHPNDTRRVLRALEIYETTGKSMTENNAETGAYKDVYDLRLFALSMPRERLYDRINRRVDEMLANGLIAEVKGLLEAGLAPGCTAMQAIGYKEIISMLRGETDEDTAIELLKQHTRNYAKRQLTWLRHDKRVIWLEVGEDDTPATLADRLLRTMEES